MNRKTVLAAAFMSGACYRLHLDLCDVRKSFEWAVSGLDAACREFQIRDEWGY